VTVKYVDGNEVPNEQSLGQRLASVRKAKGLNQREMADSVKLSYRSYRAYETDDREPPFYAMVEVVRLYKLDAEWFMFGDQDRTAPTERDVE
jgi:transcriptional regulator with XRE-family HTH domain